MPAPPTPPGKSWHHVHRLGKVLLRCGDEHQGCAVGEVERQGLDPVVHRADICMLHVAQDNILHAAVAEIPQL